MMIYLYFTWYLFYKYLDNRFDIMEIKKQFKHIKKYYKYSRNLSVLIRSFGKYSIMIISMYKLNNRKLIPAKMYKELKMNYMKYILL